VGLLIDTSVFIEHERGRLELSELVKGHEDEDAYVSVITASELLHGVHRARSAGLRAHRSAFVETVLTEFPTLPVDILTARTHARLWAELAEQGKPIGAHDLWLAATCLARGLAIASGDEAGFSKVPGLEIHAWSE